MSKPIVIVESPNKIKKLKSYKGGEYEFAASVGHFRDLPAKSMGVGAPDYEPEYEVTNKDVVKKLKSLTKGRDVILATDPDREGEAIAWHLVDELNLKNARRVTFEEITKPALDRAFSNPRGLDANLVRAQEGRRVLDRLVGYRVSSALSDLAGDRHSAGRVQSPALRLVVDREREIEHFQPQTHYGVVATFDTNGIEWKAEWDFRRNADVKIWVDKAAAEDVAAAEVFTVSELNTEAKKRNPPAPFTTSTLQQAASATLKMKPKRTMEIAQELFADGLITYMRTDSPNLSDEAIDSVWRYLNQHELNDCVPDAPNRWKSKAGAQEAHEAIRPTDFDNRRPEDLQEDAAALYELIWTRAVASQMKSAVYDVTTMVFDTDKSVNDKPVLFKSTGRVLRFDGWLRLTDDKAEEDKTDDKDQALPSLSESDRLTAEDTAVVTRETKPPKRYTQAGLIKELEKRGIGRPATYASILETLFRREYLVETKNLLRPTERGCLVRDCLVDRFAFAEYEYTREMEDGLDEIAEGQGDYLKLVSGIDRQLDGELEKLEKAVDIEQHACPAEGCDGSLRRRPGKFGAFWGCTNYPDCKETRPDAGGKPGEPKARAEVSDDYQCAECGRGLVRRKSPKGKKRGYFWGCSGFPECRETYRDRRGAPVFEAS